MAGHRSLIRPLVGLLLLLGACLLGPAAAHAAEGKSLPDGDFTAVYAGTLVERLGGANNSRSQGQLEMYCTAGKCTFFLPGSRSAAPAEPTAAQGSVVTFTRTYRSRPLSGCPELVVVDTDTIRADGASATYTLTSPADQTTACSGGTDSASTPARRVRFTGSLTSLQVQERPDAATPTPTPAAPSSGAGPGTPPRDDDAVSASRLESGEADAPSVLSALPTVAESSMGPGRLLALVAAVVVLVLLIAFPTHLLDSATESGRERWQAWRQRRRGDSDAAPEDTHTPVLSPRRWAAAAGVVLAASLIGAFIDPGFGFNAGSLRVVGSLFVALAVESLLVWFAVIWATRRAEATTIAGFHAAPGTLLVVAIAVLVTRLTGFEPGIVFGLVAGVTFALASTATAQGRVALAELSLAFGLALLGWFGYSFLGPAVAGDGWGRALATETLASIAIAGMASLPLALVPLRGLAGHTLWTWSKPVWAAAYGVALAGFFIVLMPMPFSWAEVGVPLRTWVLLYLAYAAAAVAAWAALTQPWRKAPTPVEPPV